MLDLDHARAMIEAEKCDTEDRYWCSVHEAWAQPAMDKCTDRPEVADVATELLAEVERLDGVSIGLLQVTVADLRAELNAALATIDRVRAVADWHETKSHKARTYRPDENAEVMDKAAKVHDDAAQRIRQALEGDDNA